MAISVQRSLSAKRICGGLMIRGHDVAVSKSRARTVQPNWHSSNARAHARARQKNRPSDLQTNSAITDKVAETAPTTHNWFKQWWPSYSVRDLHTDRPNRIQLLGEYFVVWKSAEGDWIAMKDICPHRLAPLSEGRIEDDGTIMCSYHGWRFDTCGNCVKIPQADDAKSHDAACKNQRSAAKTYPSKVVLGVLWIWPDDSKNAVEESEEAMLPIPKECIEVGERLGDRTEFNGPRMRIVPYSAQTLMENLLDPSHLPFSHHGILGRRDMKGSVSLQPTDLRFADSMAAVNVILAQLLHVLVVLSWLVIALFVLVLENLPRKETVC